MLPSLSDFVCYSTATHLFLERSKRNQHLEETFFNWARGFSRIEFSDMNSKFWRVSYWSLTKSNFNKKWILVKGNKFLKYRHLRRKKLYVSFCCKKYLPFFKDICLSLFAVFLFTWNSFVSSNRTMLLSFSVFVSELYSNCRIINWGLLLRKRDWGKIKYVVYQELQKMLCLYVKLFSYLNLQ